MPFTLMEGAMATEASYKVLQSKSGWLAKDSDRNLAAEGKTRDEAVANLQRLLSLTDRLDEKREASQTS